MSIVSWLKLPNRKLWMTELDTMMDTSNNFRTRILKFMAADVKDYTKILESKREGKLDLMKEPLMGKIFSGRDAIDAGLVDKTGTFHKVLSRKFPDTP
jgi:ClpP class serine protease